METRAHHERLLSLTEIIKQRNGKPVNRYVVIATIESLGIREVDTTQDYGFDSIKALAQHIYEHLSVPEYYQLKNESQVNAEQRDYKRISINAYMSGRASLFARDYSIGLFHLMPVAIQIAAVIIFGFSLWTYVGFNTLQSTAVVLGVIVGLIGTGGFVQATGKQVSFYWYNQDYQMTYRVIKQLLRIGCQVLVCSFIAIAVVNSFVRLYPFVFVVITFSYALLIGLLLLALAPLYTIKRRWMISAAVAIGTVIALLLHWYSDWNTYIVHWIGIIISIAAALLFLHFFFKKLIKSQKTTSNQTPRKELAIYRNINYFLYGTLLYVFVFLDRIIAWSSNTGRELPYFIYYESKYEIGMDLAILVFFLLAGVMEYNISSFSRFQEYYQRTLGFTDSTAFTKIMMTKYKRHLLLFLISGLLIFGLLYLLVNRAWGYTAVFHESLDPISTWVCIVGGLGYFFLALGMLNVLYLYTLNRHKSPALWIAGAILINAVIGVCLSRWVSYEYAVVGMLVGSVFFAALSTIYTYRFFEKLDYYYYAAY